MTLSDNEVSVLLPKKTWKIQKCIRRRIKGFIPWWDKCIDIVFPFILLMCVKEKCIQFCLLKRVRKT